MHQAHHSHSTCCGQAHHSHDTHRVQAHSSHSTCCGQECQNVAAIELCSLPGGKAGKQAGMGWLVSTQMGTRGGLHQQGEACSCSGQR